MQALLRPISTRLVDTRYIPMESSAAAVAKMKEEKFAYMEVSGQSVFIIQCHSVRMFSVKGLNIRYFYKFF